MSNFFQACGRIAYLQKHPEAARPGELDSLTDKLLSYGSKPGRNRNWFTARQMRRRTEKEIHLGDHVERAVKEPGQWLATMPDIKRKRGAK